MKCKCPNCNHIFQSVGSDVKLIELLESYKELNITEICNKLKLSRPSVYAHIKKLEISNIIITHKNKELKGAPVFVRLIKNNKQNGK